MAEETENDDGNSFEMPDLTVMQRARLKIYANNPEMLRQIFKRNNEPASGPEPQPTPVMPEKPTTPRSPLIDILQRIEKADRGMMWRIMLCPTLGYKLEREFTTANELLKYLTQDPTATESDKHRDKEFERALTLEELLACCKRHPPTIRLNDSEAKVTRIGNRIIEIKYRPLSKFKADPHVDNLVLANLHANSQDRAVNQE